MLTGHFAGGKPWGMGNTRPTLEHRFWRFVPIGPADGCWPWAGATIHDGYGVISGRGTNLVATRLMMEFVSGEPVPTGAVVCHTCDNPRCVNPKHLWIGSRRDNLRDMVAKRRHASFRTFRACPSCGYCADPLTERGRRKAEKRQHTMEKSA